jgi:hypothetical protein
MTATIRLTGAPVPTLTTTLSTTASKLPIFPLLIGESRAKVTADPALARGNQQPRQVPVSRETLPCACAGMGLGRSATIQIAPAIPHRHAAAGRCCVRSCDKGNENLS